MKVTVVHAAGPERQKTVELEAPEGTTLLEAAQQSGIADSFPELDLAAAPKGVFGQRRQNSHLLQDGDRIEIYRPLQQNPKDARRYRASCSAAASAASVGRKCPS